MAKKKVIVVGAGLSGLVAARELRRSGLIDVTVLEAREDRVGGRMVRQETKTKRGAYVDLGGQWAGKTQYHLLGLAEELGVKWFEQYKTGRIVLQFKGERYTSIYPMTPAPSEEARKEGDELWQQLVAQAELIDPAQPWNSVGAQGYDDHTLDAWVSANTTAGSFAAFHVAWEAKFNQSGGLPKQVSLLHTLFEAKANPLGEDPDDFLFAGGAGQIADLLFKELGGTRVIKLNTQVHAIEQDDMQVTVISNADSYSANGVIVAIPPPLTTEIQFKANKPEIMNWLQMRQALAQKMAMGTIAKVACVYPSPWWRALGLSGTAMGDDQMIVQAVVDSGRQDNEPGILTSFIQGDKYDVWRRMTNEKRREAVLNDLAVYFGADAKDQAEFIEALWPSERFTGGAYNGYLPPGGWTSYGAAIRAPIGRIHWAGTETATRWYGYFDGAISAGKRAAKEVLESKY